MSKIYKDEHGLFVKHGNNKLRPCPNPKYNQELVCPLGGKQHQIESHESYLEKIAKARRVTRVPTLEHPSHFFAGDNVYKQHIPSTNSARVGDANYTELWHLFYHSETP